MKSLWIDMTVPTQYFLVQLEVVHCWTTMEADAVRNQRGSEDREKNC